MFQNALISDFYMDCATLSISFLGSILYNAHMGERNRP